MEEGFAHRIVAALEAEGSRNIVVRLAGLGGLVMMLGIGWFLSATVDPLRHLSFDAYHLMEPRTPESRPAFIVDVDDASLERIGQWPWSRDEIARLLDLVAAQQPAAVAFDMLFPEPDRTSPDQLARRFARNAPEVSAGLRNLPSHDAILAQSIASVPTALAVAGLPHAEGEKAPFRRTMSMIAGADPRPFLQSHPDILQSIPILTNASRGLGAISTKSESDGVVRRMPMAVTIRGEVVPSLITELLRLAVGSPAFATITDETGVRAIRVGQVEVPTTSDGRAWIHFSPSSPERFVSAADILEGKIPPDLLSQKFVLIGSSALGLGDYHATPVSNLMQGTEIQVQLLETIFGHVMAGQPLLTRLEDAAAIELGLAAFFGLLLVAFLPMVASRWSPVLALVPIALLAGAGWVGYAEWRLLFDPTYPSLTTLIVFGVMMVLSTIAMERARRALEADLAEQRAAADRLEGELSAARQIQMSMLPDASDAFPEREDFDLHAVLVPARAVGGDLYDFFLIDDDHLFFIIGDVTDKGVPASLFMSLTKAMCASVALRLKTDVGAILAEANDEISRNNEESMFVTAFAGILDLGTGDLDYCNAGHEPPFLIIPGEDARPMPNEGGGPPLCVVPGFPYMSDSIQLRPGEILLGVTDGISEALDPEKAMYSAERIGTALNTVAADATAAQSVDRLLADVKAFVRGAEQSDDITVLAVRFIGSVSGTSPPAELAEPEQVSAP